MKETALFERPCPEAEPELQVIVERPILPRTSQRVITTLVWSGVDVDLPTQPGPIFPFWQIQAVRRFQKAVRDGKVYKNARIVRNSAGKSYVKADGLTNGRILEAFLIEIGY